MNVIKDIRHDLIDEIMQTEDVNLLNSIYHQLEKGKQITDVETTEIEAAIVEITEGVTLDQVVEAQSIEPITYSEIRVIVDEIDWDISLEELLQNID
ncbi:MAG: hypothetical protein AAGI23_06295 [Bacteroidota bacterium]